MICQRYALLSTPVGSCKSCRRVVSARRVLAEKGSEEADGAAQSGCPFSRVLPEKTRLPFWKELNLVRDPDVVQKEILQGQDIAVGNFMLQEGVMVGSLDLTRSILAKHGDSLEGTLPPHMEALLGPQSLAVVTGKEHAKIRQLMYEPLSASSFGRYFPVLLDLCNKYMQRWAAKGHLDQWQKEIKLLTFEVICSVVAGFQFSDEELAQMSEWYGTFVKGITFPLTWDVPFTPFGQAMQARRKILDKVKEQVNRVKGSSSAEREGARCMLDQLVHARDEEGQPLAEDQILDNFIGLLLAGHDTTASSLSACVYFLAQHPDVMEKLRAEQMQCMASHGPDLSYPQLSTMTYLDAVLRETWRCQPIVPVIARRAIKDTVVEGWQIPAGTNVTIALNHLMKSDPRWSCSTGALDPHNFNPDRFLMEDGQAQGHQLVFGLGKRACLGASLAMAEARLFLAVLARGYQYQVVGPVKVVPFPFPVVELDVDFHVAKP